jgi:hypothetical protein
MDALLQDLPDHGQALPDRILVGLDQGLDGDVEGQLEPIQ